MIKRYIASLFILTVLLITSIIPIQSIQVLAEEPIGEILSERTRHSKKHYLGDNQYSIRSSLGAIHYQENETWWDIDNSWYATDPPWDWTMQLADYHTWVKANFTDGQILAYETQGQAVFFQPMLLEYTNDLDQLQPISEPQDVTPTLEVENGSVEWQDAYGSGIDFKWDNNSTRFNKLLTIDSLVSLPTPEQYILDGGNAGLKLSFIFNPDASLDIVVDGLAWDKKSDIETYDIIEFQYLGEVLFVFTPLQYWDSSENPEGHSYGKTTLSKKGNSLYINTITPYEWLETATYPVYIDPTIDADVATGNDDGYATTAGGYDGTYSRATYGEYSGTEYEAWTRFDGITIPQSATINTANVSYSVQYVYVGGALMEMYAEDANDPSYPTDQADYYSRTLTTASNSFQDTSTGETSHSIISVIQELVNSYDYSSEAIQLLWYDASSTNRYNKFYTYENGGVIPNLYIEYTSGGDPDISNTPDSYAFGVMNESASANTGLTYFTVTNNSGFAVDISISGTDFTGNTTITLSDTATPGVDTAGLLAGLNGGSFNITVKKTAPYNDLVTSLADSGTQDWGIRILAPTSYTEPDNPGTTTSNITLTAEAS